MPKRIFVGNSMTPLLLDGDLVFLKNITFPQIQVNDIVMVKKNGGDFIHRVIYKTNTYLITKGDNNLKDDGKIYPKNILGKVFKVERNGYSFDPEDLYLLQSALYFQEIVKIKRALEKITNNYVFLKGLPIHLYFDKSHPKRIYADCDILIADKNYRKLGKILEEFGYRKEELSLSSLSKTFKSFRSKESAIAFYKVINGIPIVFDIHLEAVFTITQLKLDPLYPQSLINKLTNVFLKEKRIVKIKEEEFPILLTEHLVIFLSLHLFHHNFKGYNRYDFLSLVLKAKNIDFKKISDIILHYKTQKFVYPVFLLYKRYYNPKIPKTFLNSIKPNRDQSFISNLVSKIDVFEDESRIEAGINRFKYLFFLSPEPLIKRFLIFLNTGVFLSIVWILWRKLPVLRNPLRQKPPST